MVVVVALLIITFTYRHIPAAVLLVRVRWLAKFLVAYLISIHSENFFSTAEKVVQKISNSWIAVGSLILDFMKLCFIWWAKLRMDFFVSKKPRSLTWALQIHMKIFRVLCGLFRSRNTAFRRNQSRILFNKGEQQVSKLENIHSSRCSVRNRLYISPKKQIWNWEKRL